MIRPVVGSTSIGNLASGMSVGPWMGALAFVATAGLSIVNAVALGGLVALPSGFFVLSSVLSGVAAALLIAGLAAGLPVDVAP